MTTEGKGPIVIPCYLVGGVPYVLEVDAAGKLAVRAAEIETLLGGGLPAALDGLSLKVKEQSPITGFATSAKQDTMITALQLIDDLRAALLLVGTDRLGVRATEIETLLGAGLPVALDSLALKVKEQSPISGFATSANQATMITALQLIDDLRAALGSVNTDDLQVDVKTMPTVTVQAAGGDKIHAIESALGQANSYPDLAGGFIAVTTTPVPAGKMWKITNICWQYNGTVPSRAWLQAVISSNAYTLKLWSTITTGIWLDVQCEVWLGAGDYLRLYLYSATAHDSAGIELIGYQMDAP